MQELHFKLDDPTYDQLRIEGRNRLIAGDREHPAVRFYIHEDVKQQLAYEATQQQPQKQLSLEAIQLILFAV